MRKEKININGIIKNGLGEKLSDFNLEVHNAYYEEGKNSLFISKGVFLEYEHFFSFTLAKKENIETGFYVALENESNNPGLKIKKVNLFKKKNRFYYEVFS